jgi:uncharacterized membrane protein
MVWTASGHLVASGFAALLPGRYLYGVLFG